MYFRYLRPSLRPRVASPALGAVLFWEQWEPTAACGAGPAQILEKLPRITNDSGGRASGLCWTSLNGPEGREPQT
jgi:hypothetical protein